MSKSNKIIIVIFSIIFLVGIVNLFQNNKNPNSQHNRDSSYYLTSPWVMERTGLFLIPLPEKWAENKSLKYEKSKNAFREYIDQTYMYGLEMKDFHLVCTYYEIKEGYYDSWDMDKSATGIINQVLYNINCNDLIIDKLEPIDNPLEVNYFAKSHCNPNNFATKFKGIRFNGHILFVCICYKESDANYEKIADRIIQGIANKYSNL